MSNTLKYVEDYVAEARTLLLDKIEPYRYTDLELIAALNVTLAEARRLRSDLFLYKGKDDVQSFTEVNDTAVRMELPFRLALVYGICGHAFARDQEDVQDARATAFMETFRNMLVGQGMRQIVGGTPPGGAR